MSPIPEEGRITQERRGRILLIGIERPAKRNAFTPEMLDQLAEAFTRLERDDDAWCGLLFSPGPDFTAGLHLDRVAPRMRSGAPVFPAHLMDPMDLRPPRRSKPVVAAVQGICFTIGIELMLAADIVIAARDTRFAQLEVQRGIIAAGGGTFRFVERAGWGNAQRWLLTGDEFDAAEAHRLGFVQEVVETGAAFDRALALAGRICAAAPLAVRASLASSRLYAEQGIARAAEGLDAAQAAIARTEDAAEAVRAFVERRPARWVGR
jgi:enoyl-CoA hydratase/carnithine racemase